MEEAAQAADEFAAVYLPAWWRYVVISLATLVLCSCSSPAVRTPLHANESLLASSDTAPSAAQQPPALPGVSSANDKQETASHSEPPARSTGSGQAEPTAVGGCECNACDCNGGGNGGFAFDPYGPLVGPSDEYLCDGGDYGSPAGVTATGKIEGLDEEDAVSHYTTVDGRIIVTPSNRVCIYAPRFAAVRRVVQVAAHEQPVFVGATVEETGPAKATKALPPVLAKQRHKVAVDLGERPPSLFRQRQQAGGLENLQAAAEVFNTLAPYADLQIIRTGEVSAAEKARVERAMEAAITLTGVQAPQVVFGVKMAQAEIGVKQPGVVYETEGPNHPKLRLIKLASCGHALPGEEIEFTLRVDNIGDQVIEKVTVADNLSARLEYVPGSAKSSLDADLVVEPNEVGSNVLRWEIKNPVKPGAGGILRFKVKVR